MRRWSVAPTHARIVDTAAHTAWMPATADLQMENEASGAWLATCHCGAAIPGRVDRIRQREQQVDGSPNLKLAERHQHAHI
jgi:hypothetical protein